MESSNQPGRVRGIAGKLIFALLLLAAASAITLSFVYDARVRAAIVEAQGKGWKRTAEHDRIAAVSRYGDWPQLMLVGLVGAALAWKLKRTAWTRIFVAAMIASTLAGMLANASRLTTGRPRPREVPKIADGWYGPYHDGKILIGNSKYNAFPSGHTATAVGFAGVFVFARRWIAVLVLGGALGIAWSRMALGAHNLSDVTVSIILAMAVAFYVWRFTERHGDEVAARVLGWIGRLRKA